MIIGKWVLIDSGEHYNTGQIADVVCECFVLVKIRPFNDVPPRMALFDLSSLMDDSCSSFFNTEQELDAFVTWLDTPQEGKLKVVAINKKEGGK